ncbi:serine--tRNA ligase, mitochondrial-like isoform X3 [Eurosta solidaginis]|uniref:serine--tRNA ligase, mitochondrial-like isoform X3 n=1 Tax=Eurosta solidaginis TaxID=178769 RepID=UPI003530C7CB
MMVSVAFDCFEKVNSIILQVSHINNNILQMALFRICVNTSRRLYKCQVSRSASKYVALRNFSSSFSKLRDELDTIEKNILLRKHTNNVSIIKSLLAELSEHPGNIDALKKLELEVGKLPNRTHERLIAYGEKPCEIQRNQLPLPKVDDFSTVCKDFNYIRTDHLGNFNGHKSYYLLGDLANLEQSLIRFTVEYLKRNKFLLMSVPDILPGSFINGCGMQTEGDRTQIYKIETEECLSGTSEMALAGLFSGTVLDEKKLPLKVAAVSRCYRAETSGLNEEKGIYRVHQFTKVEMFSVCSKNQSEAVLESFKNTEVSLYEKLNFRFRVLDMPPIELGASAFQKYDIEVWMSGRQMWGEISSCSNCTDYQAKRLNIKYRTTAGNLEYAHTVNGTAAAMPRLLISLLESNKIENGTISVPESLKEILKDRNGWEQKADSLEFYWFDGDCAPNSVINAIIDEGNTVDENSTADNSYDFEQNDEDTKSDSE